MICIYTSEVSPRVSYTFKIVFEEILKVDFLLTSDLVEFDSFEGVKLVYDANYEGDCLYFQSSGILFEGDIRPQDVEVILFKKIRCLFPVTKGKLSFDPFAASFYLVTRYEEYLSSDLDNHGRYQAESSIAYQNDFLGIPVVNYYAEFVKELILEKYPDFTFKEKKTVVVPTIDIDNAYAYKYKGIVFHVGSLVKKLLKFKLREFVDHIKTIADLKYDPYNSYDTQFDVHNRFGLKAVYFFLVGEKGAFDKNLSITNKNYHKLIKEVSLNNKVGIHPSYGSEISKVKIIGKEKTDLEKVLNSKISASRQHYLKMTLADTYLALENCGITDDYTMGYASQIGFRAGVCIPYTFYYVGLERESKLTVHPFCMMDSTLKYYLKVDGVDVLNKVQPLFDEVKNVKGEINVLFHNESIGAKHCWEGWEGLYEKILNIAVND